MESGDRSQKEKWNGRLAILSIANTDGRHVILTSDSCLFNRSFLTLGAPLPTLGSAPSVHDRNDDYGFAVTSIVDSIGEAMEKGASRLAMDHRIGGRVRSKLSHCRIDGGQIRLAQAHPLPLIPPIRFLNVGSGGRAEE
jgi:hypothetical protein